MAARLAWAGQGAAMQAGSIRDNLALGNPAADDATLRAALAGGRRGRVRRRPAGRLGHRARRGWRRYQPGSTAAAGPWPGRSPDRRPWCCWTSRRRPWTSRHEQRVLAGIARRSPRPHGRPGHPPLAPLALADQVDHAALGRSRRPRRPPRRDRGRGRAADRRWARGERSTRALRVPARRPRNRPTGVPTEPPAAPRSGPRSPLLRLWGQARGVRGRLVGAAVLGGLASGCAVGARWRRRPG